MPPGAIDDEWLRLSEPPRHEYGDPKAQSIKIKRSGARAYKGVVEAVIERQLSLARKREEREEREEGLAGEEGGGYADDYAEMPPE